MKKQTIPYPIMRVILRWVIDPSLSPDCHENRTRIGMLAGWVSTALSAVLAIVKCWLGMVSGSVSLIADATNNLTDMGSSLVIALGFQWSRKPRDEDHPFGHGRIEAVATLILAIALIVVGAEVTKSGIMRLIHPREVGAPLWVLVATGFTVAVKLWMAVFANTLAKLSKSPVLEADAWNHAFDVVCTLLVIVALFSSRMGWSMVDGIAAIVVGIFILYTGIRYAGDAIDHLLGQKPDPSEVREIYKAVVAVDGVMGAHEIMVHQYGDVKMVSFHIEVDAKMSLIAAHDVAELAEDAVESTLQWRAVAHVDPVDRSHSLFEELNQHLHQFLVHEPGLVDVHDLRAHGEHVPYGVSFDLVTDLETSRDDYDTLCEHCIEMIQSHFGQRVNQVEIGIEAAVESAPMIRRKFELSVG